MRLLYEKLTKESNLCLMSKDFFRIDCGLIIERKPIFLTYD